MSQEFKAETKFGTVKVMPTEAKHIYVSFSSGHRDESLLTVRGIEYSGSAHFYLHAEGWKIGTPEQPEYQRRSYLYLSRVGSGNHVASTAAGNAIADELTRVMGEWVAANPQALTLAEVDSLEGQIKKMDEEIAELDRKMSAAVQKRYELSVKFHTLGGTL